MIVVGPSGVGKSTMIKFLTTKYPNSFGFSSSFTTRDMRPGEIDGVHYNFISREQFLHMIEEDDFIEWANVHKNMYGTAKSEIKRI